MLAFDQIDVYYDDTQALWNLSGSIGKKEIVALVGSNGAGKSTLLKTISGLLKPAQGELTFNGILLNKLSVHQIVELGISLVPEGRRVFSDISVRENLEVGAYSTRARKNSNESLDFVFEIFPLLKDRVKQPAGTLSGGEQQMLAIGRSLMSKPELLLLDEMSQGLAPIVVQNIAKAIKQINKTWGIAVFLVEQNVHLALSLADRGYIIENGKLIAQGEAKSLLNSSQVREAYLGIGRPEGVYQR